jgi:shikimate dehydrogenase
MLSLGLLGYPLSYSLSPRLHAAAMHEMGLNGEYQLYPVPPLPQGAAQLAAIFQRMRLGEIDGLNVTIPHKQTVLFHMDEFTETAQAIGAVNTILVENGRLIGDNTDAAGFLADLKRVLPDVPRPRGALVLGAGGAARAVVYSLLSTGWDVSVAARRAEQAEALVDSLRVSQDPLKHAAPAVLEADSLQRLVPKIGLVVNASSAGMLPDIESSPWPAGVGLPIQAFVYDLVYKPPETALLNQARAAGLPAANGMGMLIEQAALALERWSGQPVPRQVMWQVIKS